MNKIVANGHEAICRICANVGATISKNEVVCSHCGAKELVNIFGGIFLPVFEIDKNKTYQVSKYTPKLPDRRENNRLWPKIKERRSASRR